MAIRAGEPIAGAKVSVAYAYLFDQARVYLPPEAVRPPVVTDALVVSFKSLDGLIADAKYVAELAGRSEEAAQFEKMFKNQFGGPKGLEGIDPKKPIGLYARLSPDPSTPQASDTPMNKSIANWMMRRQS